MNASGAAGCRLWRKGGVSGNKKKKLNVLITHVNETKEAGCKKTNGLGGRKQYKRDPEGRRSKEREEKEIEVYVKRGHGKRRDVVIGRKQSINLNLGL